MFAMLHTEKISTNIVCWTSIHTSGMFQSKIFFLKISEKKHKAIALGVFQFYLNFFFQLTIPEVCMEVQHTKFVEIFRLCNIANIHWHFK